MKILIHKNVWYQLLFALCVAVPYLNIYELTFVVWSVAAAVTVRTRYSVAILKQVACFAAILFIGLVVLCFHDYVKYYIFRDIAYIVKPVIGLLLGYQLCKSTFKNVFEMICNTAMFIAIGHILLLVTAVIVNRAYTLNDLRLYGGYFSDFEVYALIILIFNQKFELDFSARKRNWFLVIVGFSAFMYLARTNFIQFVILFLAMKGYFRITPKAVTVIASVALLGIIGYSTILYINPKRNGPGMEAFLYKIKVAPIEPFKTKINREDWRDFNDNYRSYENIMTIREVSQSPSAVLFGKGIGSKIDLKQELLLGDMKLRFISILHNGFMTVYLKSGLLGVSILIYSIYLLFKTTRSEIPIVRQINYLMVGSGVFMIISYWVFMGYYLIADTKALLFGLLICYREMVVKHHKYAAIEND